MQISLKMASEITHSTTVWLLKSQNCRAQKVKTYLTQNSLHLNSPISKYFNLVSFTSNLWCFLPGYTVIGFAMYYFTYDPWIGKLLYLEDFYVMQEFRGEIVNMCCYIMVVKANE